MSRMISIREALTMIDPPQLDHRNRTRLRERLILEAGALGGRRMKRRWMIVAASGLVASLVAMIVMLSTPESQSPLIAEVARHHEKLLTSGPSELRAVGDEDEMADYFEKAIGFRPELPRRKCPDLTIMGGKVCSLGGEAVAYIVYQCNGEMITYIARHPATRDRTVAFATTVNRGYTIIPIGSKNRTGDDPLVQGFLAAKMPELNLNNLFDLLPT